MEKSNNQDNKKEKPNSKKKKAPDFDAMLKALMAVKPPQKES
ncbi:hypothetical protein ACFP1I_22230 [Dyadobacter subterraneus]|nr:hypothetical protein [Dyadobacter subterraneus]